MRHKPETFSRFDPAEHLKTEAQIAAYLEVALEEGGDDPRFMAEALGVIARSRNMSELARAAHISREGLYKALSKDGNPSFGTVLKVAKALGLKLALLPVMQAERFFKARRGRADLRKFDAIMKRKGSVPPREGDRQRN